MKELPTRFDLIIGRMQCGKTATSKIPNINPTKYGELELPDCAFEIVNGVINSICQFQGLNYERLKKHPRYEEILLTLVKDLPSRNFIEEFGKDNNVIFGDPKLNFWAGVQVMAGNLTRTYDFSYMINKDLIVRREHGGVISMSIINDLLGGRKALAKTQFDVELSNNGKYSDATTDLFYRSVIDSAPPFIEYTKNKLKQLKEAKVPVTTTLVSSAPDFFLPDKVHELCESEVVVNTEAYTAVLVLSTSKQELNLEGKHSLIYHKFDIFKPADELLQVIAYKEFGKNIPDWIDTKSNTPYRKILEKHELITAGVREVLGDDGYIELVKELREGKIGPQSRYVLEYCNEKINTTFRIIAPIMEKNGVAPINPADCNEEYCTSLHLGGDFIRNAMKVALMENENVKY